MTAERPQGAAASHHLMLEYHRRSDHGRDGGTLDEFLCNCRELFEAHDREVVAAALRDAANIVLANTAWHSLSGWRKLQVAASRGQAMTFGPTQIADWLHRRADAILGAAS